MSAWYETCDWKTTWDLQKICTRYLCTETSPVDVSNVTVAGCPRSIVELRQVEKTGKYESPAVPTILYHKKVLRIGGTNYPRDFEMLEHFKV